MRWLLAVMLVGTVAFADTPESTKLFEEGRALGKDGKWKEACDKFAKSLELDAATGTQLNYADCHEHLGHLAQAWRLFDAAADAADKDHDADRSKYARQRSAALLLKVGTVVVKLATPNAPGMTVSIAGRTTKPAAEIRDIVDPGDVTVEVSAPNMESMRKTERVEAGKTVVIEIPALTETPHPSTTTTERRHSRVVTGYALGGIGAASFATGIVVGLVAKSRYDQQLDTNCTSSSPPMCNADGYRAQNSAIALGNVATVLSIGGLVLVGTGAVVYFTAPRDVVVTPIASTQSAGLAVVGRF